MVTGTERGKINACSKKQVAEVLMDAQNGRRSDFDVRMKTPCKKKQKAKRKAAAKHKAG